MPSKPGFGVASIWLNEGTSGQPKTIAARLCDLPVASTNGGSTWQEGVLSPGTGGLWCLMVRLRLVPGTVPMPKSSLDIWVGGMGMGPKPAGLWQASILQIPLLQRERLTPQRSRDLAPSG